MPDEQTLMELLAKDSAMKFIDNIHTPARETLFDIMTIAFKKAATEFTMRGGEPGLEWTKYNNPAVYHLIRDLKPFARTGLKTGGYGNIINAIKGSHGPSWRMIVQLSSPAEAYGIYPGGQSGNPGSKYYDNMVDTWARGEYHKLWYMREGDKNDAKVKWRMKMERGE
jgi:penicillin amidase